VKLPVKYGQTLAVDLYLKSSGNGTITAHTSAGQGSFAAAGNHTGERAGTAFSTDLSMWYFLDGVDVKADPAVHGSVVALGDSITDGAYSTYSGNKRWTDDLAARINLLPTALRHGVLNQGIGGNRVIAFRGDCCPESDSALARLDRDVAAQTDARYLIIADGINDLGYGATAAGLIAGLHQVAVRAHGYGLKVIGGTITPYGCDGGCLPASEETVRQQVNHYLRTSPDFDGFADFDAAVRDPADPARTLPAYDAGDHLHLNDAGYAAMAGAVDLRLLR
jgi:lysophospholipase L1-like esterase